MMRLGLKKIWFLVILLLGYVSAYSQTNCKSFTASDFVLNGTATVSGTNEVILTSDSNYIFGTIWSQQKIVFNKDFKIDADLFFGYNDYGADGIAFVLQPLSSDAGQVGGGLGYLGISPSLSIEFDTYFNGISDPPSQINPTKIDPFFNDHIALMKNGDTGVHNSIISPLDVGNLEDGKWHRVIIEWTAATKTLKLTFDGVVLYNLVIDLKTIFPDNDSVFWGFTAATGGSKNLQKVRFSSYCATIESTVPPVGNSVQVFCNASPPTIANLSATGKNIKWYSTATGGTALPAAVLLTDGATYYASQTIDGIESTDRLAVKVVINTPQITASATEVCIGTVVELSVESQTQVNNFCSLPINLQNGLVGYWPFCGNANDVSGHGNNGTVNGATLTTDRFGNYNSAYNFDGNDYIETKRNELKSFTANLWMNLSTSSCFSSLIDAYPSTWEFLTDCISGTNLSAAIWNDSYNYTIYKSDFIVPINKWLNVTMTFENNFLKIYANGSLVFSGPSIQLQSLSGFFYFGRSKSGTDQFLNGKLDDIAVWNRVLNESEVKQMYSLGNVNYLWSTGETTPSISVTPSVTTDYWVDVTINGVTCRKYLTIKVNPKVVPSFTPISPVCSGSSMAALPTTSLNGVKGIWSPALNNTVTTTYTFTPDAGQCADTATMTIIVNPIPAAPIGNTVQVFCATPPPTVADLTATGNNIKWYSSTTAGSVLENTTPLVDGVSYYASQTIDGCESKDRLEVKVVINTPNITPSKSEICLGESVMLKAGEDLPTICNMNITLTKIPLGNPIPGFTFKGKYNGHYYYVYNTPTTWTQGEAICRANGGYLVCINDINENNFVSNLTNNNIWIGMFRDPKTGNFRWLDCMDITFTNWRSGEPNNGPFGEPYVQIIRGCSFGLNTWNNLDNNSTNGTCYSNMVPIMEIDPSIYSNVSGYIISYLWSTGETTPSISVTPSVTTDYWVDVTINGVTCRKYMTIKVNPKVVPSFTPVSPVCSGSSLVDLPTTSLNGIRGAWSPALNNTITTTYTFTPDAGQCADITTMTIIVNPTIIPSFNQVDPICEGSTLITLPNISSNGIKGSWSPVVNNSVTTTYTFTPDSGQCANTATMTIVVNPKVIPTFTPVNPVCYGATMLSLPSISLNGIKGSWSPAINNKATTTYTFTPDALYCAVSVNLTVEVSPIENVQYELTTSGSNIIVEILNYASTAFEYSTDNIKWQSSNIFYNLPNNTYPVYIRNKTGCLVASDNILLLNVPNVITPNDDGFNDRWTIPGIEKYPAAKIIVLDRFGNKVLDQVVGKGFQWDGKYLSRPLPTGNYWFIVVFESGKEIKGFLTIKNRN